MRSCNVVLALVVCATVSAATAGPRDSGPRLDVTFGRSGGVSLRAPSQVHPTRTFVPDWLLYDSVADRSGSAYMLFGGLGAATVVLGAYDAEGRLNRQFGDNGVLALGALGSFRHVAVDSAGRILVLGEPDPADPDYPGAVVLRVLPDGRLDPAFGFGGVQRRASPALYPWDIFSDGSGGVLVLERSISVPLRVVFRLGPDGMLDRTYGDDGVAVVPRIGVFDLRAHTVDATGRFVAVDSIDDVLPTHHALVGLDASGRPDSTLGAQGMRVLDFGARDPGVRDLGIDAMGRYVVLGVGEPPRTAPFIARYLSDGTPDATWSGTSDGVREILTDGALPGTDLDMLRIDGASYFASGTRYDDHAPGRDWGDSVVVRVDDGTEQVWTSRTRRFKFGLDVLAVRDGTVLALGDDRRRRRPRRMIPSFVRLLFD